MTAPEDEGSPRFVDADLSGSRFVRTSLVGAVMRAVEVGGADIDAPWLLEGDDVLLVNGVDVVPYVRAELDRRFPGRAGSRAGDADGLRAAWAAVERAWAAAVDRAASMPSGTVDAQVDGEWSFAQTLRHLVMATDTWLRGAVLGIEQPYSPLGQPNTEYAIDGYDPSVFSDAAPTWDEVLRVRAKRQAMVRDHLSSITDEDLAGLRANPWAPGIQETVLSCLRTVLEEEWEHLRFALRDLDALDAGQPRGRAGRGADDAG